MADGNVDGIKVREMVTAKMTGVQIVEAERLAREWKPILEKYDK